MSIPGKNLKHQTSDKVYLKNAKNQSGLRKIVYLFPLIYKKTIIKMLCFVFCILSAPLIAEAQQCQPGGPPQLSASTGPGFKEITLTWTGVSGSNGWYWVYGRPDDGTWGDPIQVYVEAGQTKEYKTNAYGILAYLQTYKTYHFNVNTSICGVSTNSNIATATTRDIDAPSLAISPGPDFEELTLTWTGVQGASDYYNIFGSPDGGTTWGDSLQTFVQPGQTTTYKTKAWGILAFMETNKPYHFYIAVCADSRCKQSNIVSETTRDIDAPQLFVTQQEDNKAKLSWNRVEGAQTYNVFTFSTAQNQWNSYGQFQQPSDPNAVLTFVDPLVTPNQTRYYYVTANRTSRSRQSNKVSTAFYQDQNNGNTSCKMAMGEPVNLSNGNMYINHTDYDLPGAIDGISLIRTYNSAIQSSGLFGYGWSSGFEESVTFQDQYNLRYLLGDGRAVYFGRTDTTQPFQPVTADFYGQIVRNADLTFILTLKDGRTQKFDSSGKLLWRKDRNGNQTTLSYNTNGFLTGITDAFGRTLTVTPNANGTIQQISDGLGTIATYEYFPNTTLLKTVAYNDGSKYKFEYDTTTAPGKTLLKTVKDALDNILETHEYDSQGRATTSEKHGGAEKYTLDFSNWSAIEPHTIVTDALGRASKYYFDKSKGRNVITKTEGVCSCGGAGSEITTFEYDARLNLKKKVDALGRETVYTYDENGNRLTQTDKLGTFELGKETYTYNPFGQVVTYKDRMNGEWVNTYDEYGNLKTIKDPLNYVTTIEYPATNNKGLPDSIKDARNHTTKYKWFSSSGLLQETEDPNGKKTSFTYDARGRIKTVTDALSQVTVYDYFDDTQRKVEMIYPNADKITYKYNIRRLLESVTDERGKMTAYEFDEAYRLKKIIDPLNHSKEFGYDLMSNLKWQKDALGNQTDYKYDDFNRLKEIEYPPAATGATRLKESFKYDKVGRINEVTDTASRISVYTYNDATRTNTFTNAGQETTTTKYNQRFQTIEVKDALDQVYQFTYDPFGRVLTQTRAGSTMSYEYDEVGNRKKRTDYLGRVTNYTYDKLNRLEKIEYDGGAGNPTPDLQATYTYDEVSRLKTATNETGTVLFNYDSRNRITSTTDVFGHTIVYEYERTATVNQKRLRFDGAMYAAYNFDDAGRLANIINSSDNTTVSFGYDNADRLISKAFPNGITTTYDYDNMSRLKRLKDASSTTTFFDRQYSYNLANQIEIIAEPTQIRNFEYDSVNRLTDLIYALPRPAGVSPEKAALVTNESYNYDDVGNRSSSHKSASYSYQPFNKLTATATATYAYDANGNLVRKAEAPNLWRYNWDYENRLTTVSNRKHTVRYLYDALGRRVQRYLVGGKENTKFIYDGQDVLVDDNSGVLTKYLNGEGIDNKLRVQTGSDVKYFLTDHLGSTNGLADSSGNLTATNSYDSFGNATNANFPTRYQFTGREFDSFTGLHYYRARFYDANLGRFISEDPIGLASGEINIYSYAKNNPLRFKDPDGKTPLLIAAAILGGIALEVGLHIYLSEQADSIKWQGGDAQGRKRHCWVNCWSTRLHFGNPLVVELGGTAKEVVNMYQYWQNGDLAFGADDSFKDLQANHKGQAFAFIFWKGCQELCEDCQ